MSENLREVLQLENIATKKDDVQIIKELWTSRIILIHMSLQVHYGLR
jgi:hypothetical protein